jgi:hypothetical protein
MTLFTACPRRRFPCLKSVGYAALAVLCLLRSDRARADLVTDGGANLGAFDIVIVPGAALAGNVPALAAFNRAAAQWEGFISDPITVTVNANLAVLGAGILGSTSVQYVTNRSYTTVRNQMVADASDEADDVVAQNLPVSSTQFTTPLPLSGVLIGSKANFKALGFAGLDAEFGTSDGSITFSSTFGFDYDNSVGGGGVTPGLFDFETVAAHEIGHLLGFLSFVDLAPFNTSAFPSTLDMFRFENNTANDPNTLSDFITFPRTLVPGVAANFDQINAADGALAEIPMSTGLSGDGRQASHWRDDALVGANLGVMDPTLSPGVITPIKANDLEALDLIGYEITAIPEVSSLIMLAGVGGLSAGFARFRRLRNSRS